MKQIIFNANREHLLVISRLVLKIIVDWHLSIYLIFNKCDKYVNKDKYIGIP